MHKLTRPTIGITTFGENESGHYHLANTYVEGVRRAGGLPILLPPGQPQEGAAILEVVDGLILSGGGDLDPATYKGPAHPAISHVNPERDRFEITLAKLALNTEIPILGICRGIGVLNVVSGGTLVPHIPDEFGEIVAHMGSTQTVEHQVWIEPKSRLASIVAATEATVVSGHHQTVRSVPSGWRIAALASDGVIEALEHECHPWAIALQWHPEMSIDDPIQQRIFHALVEAACARKIRGRANQN